MSVAAIGIKNYRSVRALRFPVAPVTVFVGRNGVGKTNLYRALQLLHWAATGTITRAIAEEGGIESVLWAGRRPKGEPVRLVLSATIAHLEYRIEIGLPAPVEAALALEPLVKEEELTSHSGGRPVTMMRRSGPSAWLTDDEGRKQTHERTLLPSETALSAFRDGKAYPELEIVRQELAGWRFYHDFRTDAGSPIRRPCLALSTPTLSSDGHDLAAVIETVRRIRQDDTDMRRAVEEAFPGARLESATVEGRCHLGVRFPDQPRAFAAHELSDGTLRYLCLVGALAGYRLPALVALNEPESSLHPELIPALAGLIARAAPRTRMWIVTHSEHLAAEIESRTGAEPRRVFRDRNGTGLEGLTAAGAFRESEE
jgi:predicted ATPase